MVGLVYRHDLPLLYGANQVGCGESGLVLAITKHIVFKEPNMFEETEYLTDLDRKTMEQCIAYVEKEKQIYTLLDRYPHPHLMRSILCTREGIFMPRLETDLSFRLKASGENSPSSNTKDRWIRQLVSAAAWLEKLGYAHGDLRPHNILVDESSNLVVMDFETTVPIGAEVIPTMMPFCKLDKDIRAPPAGAENEQFALGSCIYNIRFGFAPYADLSVDSSISEQMQMRGEYPSTAGDRYGQIIENCWHGVYPSIKDLEVDVLKMSDTTSHPPIPRPSYLWRVYLLAQCHEHVAKNRVLMANGVLKKIRLRYQVLIWTFVRTGLGIVYGEGLLV